MVVQSNVTLSTEGSNIGRSFGRNVTYVLDDRLRPVPLGCVGQLFISGPQVACGYMGNEEQTAKSFVKDPFNPGYTMYASGDLVRISPVDHTFTFLGRHDTQIKIRGLTVETGEIEEVLKAAHNAAENAAVTNADSLMHEFINPYATPQTELQFILRTLWGSVLHIDENILGIDDNFFMAGGDSILAIRLSSSARDVKINLPVTVIIRNPTIREMSQILQSPNSNDNYDDDYDDEQSLITLDKMQPQDLTLFHFATERLDLFRNVLLPSKNIFAR